MAFKPYGARAVHAMQCHATLQPSTCNPHWTLKLMHDEHLLDQACAAECPNPCAPKVTWSGTKSRGGLMTCPVNMTFCRPSEPRSRKDLNRAVPLKARFSVSPITCTGNNRRFCC